MSGKRIFVTGIGTEVGKTLVSSILVRALEADYWKPVQAGDLDNTDAMKVERWATNSKSAFHPSAYNLLHPMSPHASADLEGIELDLNDLKIPETENNLVIEGAGGLLVPLNHQQTYADWISEEVEVVVVSRNYLGSINHTLLTLETLQNRSIKVKGLIISGEENKATEQIIEELSGVPILVRIPELSEVNENSIEQTAKELSIEIRKALIG